MEVKRMKKTEQELSKTFDSQRKRLEELGYSKQVIEKAKKLKEPAIKKARQMTFGKNNSSLLIVVPKEEEDINEQMKMIGGENYLDVDKISNVTDIPKEVYIAFDIENGKETQGKSPEDSEEIIQKQNRECFIPEENIALQAQTNVLQDHNIDATGSRYGPSGRVPDLFLIVSRPKLYSYDIGHANGRWGSPSRSKELVFGT